jgi:hypothetical protein
VTIVKAECVSSSFCLKIGISFGANILLQFYEKWRRHNRTKEYGTIDRTGYITVTGVTVNILAIKIDSHLSCVYFIEKIASAWPTGNRSVSCGAKDIYEVAICTSWTTKHVRRKVHNINYIYHLVARVLRIIFWPERNEIIGGWSKMHNEELHNLSLSPNIIRIIKSRRMGWTGHVASMGKERNAYRVLVGKPEKKRYY